MASLNENFKIKNGLTVNTTISAGSCVEADSFVKHDGTSSQFLKADGSVDSTTYTTCLGDITNVSTSTDYMTGGGASGSVEIGIDSACTTKWDNAASGGVQSLSAGDGLLDNGTSTDPNIAVDSTVVRTSGAQSIAGVKTFTDAVCVAANIYHDGDSNTYIQFGNDSQKFVAGACTMLCLDENGQDHLVVNPLNENVDLRVKTATANDTLFVSATADKVGIGTDTPSACLHVDDDGATGTGICVTGGGNGAALAQFTRTVSGGTGTVKIMSPDSSPQMSFCSTSNTYSIGTRGSCFQIADNAKLCANTRLTIDNTGQVGIGTETPGELLDVVGGNVQVTDGEFIGDLRGAVQFHGQAGEDLAAGDAVYISGISGTVTVVSKADADDSSKMPAFGIVNAAATSGNPVEVVQFGDLAGLDTTGWGVEGTELFIDTTAGAIVSAAPTGEGSSLQKIAKVTRYHASAGSITIMGAGRSNAVPNLNNGNIFIGNGSNQPTTASLASCICATSDSRYIQGVSTGPYLTGGGSTGTVTVGIDSACASKWDTAAAGDISEICLTAGLSGSSLTNGIACIGLDSATAASLDQSALESCAGLDCTGVVQTIGGGDGIDVTGTAATKSVAVDSTVVRTTGTQTVGGSKTFSDAVCITGGTTSTDAFCITNSDDTADAAPVFTMKRDSASPADGDYLGQIKFKGENSTGGEVVYAKITGKTSDVTAGTEDGLIETAVQKGSTQTIVSRQTHDALKLINGTGLEVDGNILSAGSNLNTLFSNCQGTTTASNSQTFTNKSGNISQWTNDSGYTTCTGTTTPSNTQTFTNKSGNISQWTNDSGYTTCTGDMEGIVLTTGLSGTSLTSGTACIGIDAGFVGDWDQSACPGINCTGTTTASNSQTFTNKSGNISQWTNDSGYTTCNGDITQVTAGDALSGGATSGNATIGVDAAAAANWDQSACPGINCTGTTTASNTQTFTNKSGNISQWTNNSGYTTCTGTFNTAGGGLSASGSTVAVDGALVTTLNQSSCPGINCTGTTTPSNTQTFTNKSGNISQWTNDSGYTTCNGDITAITLTGGISGASLTAGNACIGIDGSLVTTLNQSSCPGINCTGTTTASNTQTFTNKSGNISQWTNDSGYTTCTGTTTPSNTQTFTNKSGNISQWTNDSGYTTCNGDITAVTATAGLSGGGTTGEASIGLDAATANSLNQASCPGINCTGTTTASNTQTFTNKSGSNSQWTNDEGYTTCTGVVQTVGGGDGIDVTGTAATKSVAVDATVVRTSGDQTIAGCKTFSDNMTITGNLSVTGDFTSIDTCVAFTSAVEVTNHGTGPALYVNQTGSNDIMNVLDDGASVLYIEDGGNVGIGDTNPNEKLDVNGNINVTGEYKIDDSTIINATCCFFGHYAGSQITDNFISSNVAWNGAYTTAKTLSGCPGLACVGDITGVTAGGYLTGGATSGNATIGLDSACAVKWDNASAGSVSNVTASAPLASTGGTTPDISLDSACETSWDGAYTTAKALSSCAGLACVGDITAITLTGGISGASLTTGNACIGIDGTLVTTLNQSSCPGINCTGTVTSVTGGDGIDVTGSSSASVAVDGTVVRTTSDQCVGGIKHFTGAQTRATSLSATGTIIGGCLITAGFMESNAPADQVYSQGTVLAINSGGCVVESTQANDTMVFGVAAGDSVSPVVMGAEPICITGEICVGDYIVTSDKVGHGMKADNPTFGTVIGQAMESGCGDTFAIKAMIRKM